MSLPNTLFEVSWEVCNKVGGIHTVVSTKARTLVEELDDNYICIGPWLLTGGEPNAAFVEEACWAEFCDACRADGIPVRVGRWNIPGRPRAILVEFSGLYARKDEILAKLWEDYQVDSLSGGWDYVEPVLFGWAAGMVVERWRAAHPAPKSDSCVA
ncbi:MAG: alpha-glucan family phosphorylase, partial [Planctomycetota bacterium]